MLSECIVWTGPTFETHGNIYGRLPGKQMVLAHRLIYAWTHGCIPEGLVIDHLCRNGLCINVDHLEAVTNVENVMRGEGVCAKNARKTHCKRGHLLSPDNLWNRADGRRACKLCDKERYALREHQGKDSR